MRTPILSAIFKNIRRALFLAVVLTLLAGCAGQTAGATREDLAPKMAVLVPNTGALSQDGNGNEGASTPVPLEAQAASTDWAQVQKNPQRTGYTTEVLGASFRVAWTHPFQPEKVFPQVQAIVSGGKVYVGTENGNLYALDARTGVVAWKYSVGYPILNSVAVEWNKVFFGAMDGAVYALDAGSGALVWKQRLSARLGFSTAPVIADNKVMLGGRDGIFYALDPTSGHVLWQYDVGAPILQTAAWNNGRAYFGAMDMRVYAIKSTDGSLAWRSAPIDGMAFKDYWPVVVNGYVIVRPMANSMVLNEIAPGFPFNWYGTDSEWQWLMRNGTTIANGGLTSLSDAMNAQNKVMADYAANPGKYRKTLILLSEATGADALTVPHWSTQTMHGATTPPCVDRNGLLIVPIYLARSGWGRLNLSTQRVTDVLYDNRDTSGGPMNAGDYPAGMGNGDENMNVTCTGNMILGMQTEEYNANYTGAFNLDTHMWTHIDVGHTNRQMSTNTQGGGGNPASVSNGWVYHISYYELIARTTQP